MQAACSDEGKNLRLARLTVSDTATVKNLVACNVIYRQLCPAPPGFNNWVAKDVKDSGTEGGDFLAGSWRTRTLTVLDGPANGCVALSNSSRLQFQPGRYWLTVRVPAFRVGRHKARFQNVSSNQTVAFGTSEQVQEDSTNHSAIELELTVTDSSHQFEVQHKCAINQLVNGFGVASSFADAPEVYTTVTICKIESF